jgi:alkaline phosphatase D
MTSLPGLPDVSRRATLAGMAGAAALAGMPALAGARADPVFRHGVASGDPDATSVVIWTRVSEVAAGPVAWELASDAGFTRDVRKGSIATGPDRDFTVKVLVDALMPGNRYFYRFRTGYHVSTVGRTRTLPTGRLDRLGIALASCSNYAFGHFNAYAAIAADPAIDFVLHTGDYIYEYGASEWGSETARRLGRVHQPAHEIVSLADYRTRHAQYKTDAGSQAMLAAHPLLACWDDHESANNPWTGGAQNHQAATEGDWAARRAASIRAYFEWMPVREPGIGRTRDQFWRGYSFGDLALLHTLETRHTARARQIDYADHKAALTDKAAAERFMAEVVGAPDRPMLSGELEADLSDALRRSVAQGQPWRLIGSPMLIARTNVPDLAASGILGDAAKWSDEAKTLAWRGQWNLPFFTDAWDGYGWARERFYAQARAAGASDLVVLSGDSHSFWVNRLADAQGRAMGLELGTAGISSPGDFPDSGFSTGAVRALDRAVMDHNPEVEWTDSLHQGYVRLELWRGEGRASFIAIRRLDRPDPAASVLRSVRLVRKNGGVSFA